MDIVNPVPVPVTGSTTVSGTVAATQSGAWTVSSRPDLPTNPFGVTADSITVPTGRHMVIETLSIQVDVTPPGSKIAAFVSYKSGGNNVTVFVPLTFSYTEAGTGFDFYVATQAVHLYADPGTVVSLSTFSPTGTLGTGFLTASGYLI